MKMTLSRGVLGALLAGQLLIVAALLAARAGGVSEPEPFLAFDAGAADALEVGNAEGSVRLERGGDEWTVGGGLPADSDKVSEVIDKLANAAGGWPVATSGSTAERFEVTGDSHQRRIRVLAGEDALADVYLGTSPGYRKVHARHAGGGDVYAIEFSNYEAGVKAGDWLERSLLRPEGTLSRIERAGDDGFALSRLAEGGWQAASGEALDQAEVNTFVGRFTNLNVTGVSDADLAEASAVKYLLSDDGGVQEIDLYQVEEEDYVAVSSRVDGRFEVSSYIAERLDVTLADLLVQDEDESESQEGAPALEEGAGDGAGPAEETDTAEAE